jgi:saccharopine dehydrogenase (NAD+, L-lysine-forming)
VASKGLLIGIRREDKNRWERRVPLVPTDLATLRERHGLSFVVQSSPIRAFSDDEYRAAGIPVEEDLGGASVVLAVKEIPVALLRPGITYAFFAHVTKGQRHNMPLLAKLLELGCTLVDYEKITDVNNRRLVSFGRFAGYAGMIDALRCLGLRLLSEGVPNVFAEVRPAHRYRGLSEALSHLREIGARIEREGLPDAIRPMVIGITGYGMVAQGVQEILSCLPVQEIPVWDLSEEAARTPAGGPLILKVTFTERDMVRPVDTHAFFDLGEYYREPHRYVARLEEFLPYVDLLVNTIYWDPRYPRFVTRDWARRAYRPGTQPRLKVIGDISCDIGGGIELTLRPSTTEAPCYVYDPQDDAVHEFGHKNGPVIMAVDNLPCELPRESSEHFSSVLRDLVPSLAVADWEASFEDLTLPPEIKKAVVVHRGQLTPDYLYLQQFLEPPAPAGAGQENRRGEAT